MIIRNIHATFGMIDNKELQLHPGLNLVSGSNETGKSTWIAFLLTMLYGVDTRERSRGGKLPDKVRYLPWNGKPMAGTMELTAEGRDLVLERTSRSGPMADFRAWDAKTGVPVEELTGKTCGKTLLGVEAAVYTRSGYLRQQQIPVTAEAQLEKRLSGLVTAADESYAYAEIDSQLKKLRAAVEHGQTGDLPQARREKEALEERLAEIGERQQRLSELEVQLHGLWQRRKELRDILSGLDALRDKEQQDRIDAAETALAEAREDREGWEAVCADLPAEEVLQGLDAELQQLQRDLQKAALEEGRPVEELNLPEPDPVFGRMSPREAHDKAAADASLVREAANAEKPRFLLAHLWLIPVLLGLGLCLAGAIVPLVELVVLGSAVAVFGLIWWVVLRLIYDRRLHDYRSLRQEARSVLTEYDAKNARGVVVRGLSYLRMMENRALEPDGGAGHEVLAELADRRADILSRLEALMPGCSTTEKASALFQEAALSRQSLAQARQLEEQREARVRELREALGSLQAPRSDVDRFAAYDREAEGRELEALEKKLEAKTSESDMLAGAIGEMGDVLALSAEKEALDRKIRDLEDKAAALELARKALAEADGDLRSRFAPLLCEKTSALFARLTEGKYDEIRLDRDLHVTVHPADSPVFRPLSYLSGGAVDQLYLALRLAICELLIPEAPIVLDDALVNFDDQRAAVALETLRELSKTRQILLFTCQSREKRLLDEMALKRKAEASVQPNTAS